MQVRTRSATLPQYVASKESLYAAACKLLAPELPISIRLMGIRVSNFKPSEPAPSPSQPLLTTLLSAPPNGAQPGAARATLRDSESDMSAQACGVAAGPVPDRCERTSDARDAAINTASVAAADPQVHPDNTGDAAIDLADSPVAPSVRCQQAGTAWDGRSLDAAPSSGMAPCSECGELIAAAAMAQHQDWHAARKLSSELNGPGVIAEPALDTRKRMAQAHGALKADAKRNKPSAGNRAGAGGTAGVRPLTVFFRKS